MTRSEATRLHRVLWGWLAEDGFRHKDQWPGWIENGGEHIKAVRGCFLCEVGHFNRGDKTTETCDCPLLWPGNNNVKAPCERSIYGEWVDLGNFKTGLEAERRSLLATRIRDLPERSEK